MARYYIEPATYAKGDFQLGLMGYSEWWKQPVVCDSFRTFDGGASAAAPSSIEGVVYSKLPFAFHFVGLPEITSQTLLFSILVYRHLNPAEQKSEKAQFIIHALLGAIIVFMAYAAISIVFALVQNVTIDEGSADIKNMGQFIVPVVLVFICSLIKRFNLFVKLGALYVLSALSFFLYQSLILNQSGLTYALIAPVFTTFVYFLFLKISEKRAIIKE